MSQQDPKDIETAFDLHSISQHSHHTALAIGATLTTLSTSLMEWRGVTTTNGFIANFLFLAGIGVVVSTQLRDGDTCGEGEAEAEAAADDAGAGLFYAGYGAIITPSFGVMDAYGGADTVEYYNAMGLYMTSINTAHIAIFATVELCTLLLGSSYFAAADGHASGTTALQKAAGAFGFDDADAIGMHARQLLRFP
ncbi:hypothetical protein IWZ03DRAFT_360826 [Phyllosticta citriasiana]|uniref:Uncharacterized protein n=1 Tax=Phyllosticta citriasiana TaxID=595635 RepID=A0ABR1KMB3_9PEZI